MLIRLQVGYTSRRKKLFKEFQKSRKLFCGFGVLVSKMTPNQTALKGFRRCFLRAANTRLRQEVDAWFTPAE
jgi:hypothetical protein